MINIWLVLILLLGFPTGYLLAWMARDELEAGRKWFILLAIISIIVTIPVSLYSFFRLPIILSLFFIIIISLIGVWKSYDRKWTRKR